MKKFYWLLLFISLLTGCMNKTSTVLTKLENKTDRQLKLQKENLTLYCEDIDKILKIEKESGEKKNDVKKEETPDGQQKPMTLEEMKDDEDE